MFIEYKDTFPITETKFKLIDSDFEENFDSGYPPKGLKFYPIIEAIIDVYESKKLPVVSNLMRALIFFSKRNNCSSLAYAISVNKTGPNFRRYEKELEKYMVLI